MAFTLDTSGRVRALPHAPHAANWYCWEDLSPFAQGAARQVLEDWRKQRMDERWSDAIDFGFARLHPETLDRIIRDTKTALLETSSRDQFDAGAAFWRGRNTAFRKWGYPAITRLPGMFPPLTIYLGDDGNLRFDQDRKHPNGASMFAADGMMLDDKGNRSIFADNDN